MADCPKCRGRMTQGFAYLPDYGTRVKWMDGEPGFWKALTGSLRSKASELTARRCTECGFVEFFADAEAKPVKTLRSIDEENERLRSLVTRLQDRVTTLEAIATDPGERTAREIESLRKLGNGRIGEDQQRFVHRSPHRQVAVQFELRDDSLIVTPLGSLVTKEPFVDVTTECLAYERGSIHFVDRL